MGIKETPQTEANKTRIGVPSPYEPLTEEVLSTLIHQIGHEIGNPLTAIISLATIIERFPRESSLAELEAICKKSSGYAGSIIEEAWKIGALSERLVMLLTQKSSNIGATDLRRLLEKIVTKRQLRLHARKDEVMISALGQDPILARTDGEHIAVLVSELIHNAHNTLAYDFPDDAHTRPITVVLRNEGENAILTITNDVAHEFPGELSEVFQLFKTLHADRKHLGIGLCMCHAIASRYGASLRVIEQPRREIFCFTVELTLPRAEEGE